MIALFIAMRCCAYAAMGQFGVQASDRNGVVHVCEVAGHWEACLAASVASGTALIYWRACLLEGMPVAAQHATQLQLPPLHENSALNSMRPYCGMCCSSRSSEENCGRVAAGAQEAGRGI